MISSSQLLLPSFQSVVCIAVLLIEAKGQRTKVGLFTYMTKNLIYMTRHDAQRHFLHRFGHGIDHICSPQDDLGIHRK